MKEIIYSMLEQNGTLNIEEVIWHILASAVLGGCIYLSYYVTHAGTVYSRKFNTSLLTLTVLTATVMTVIGNNIALSLGMVGALSIVRFRTAVKDSRDATYIFWTIVVGICCGVGDYTVAIAGSSVVFLILLLLGRVRNDNRMLLVIRGPKSEEQRIEAIIFQGFGGKASLRVKNTTQESVELIYEMARKVYLGNQKQEKTITEALYEIERMEYVNIVTQNDEISG